MQPRPSLDRSLLIPIAVGVVSILGLVWIFLTSDLSEAIIPPTAVPTEILLATGTPGTDLPLTPSTEEEFPFTTGTSPASYPGPLLATETRPATRVPPTNTMVTETPPAPSATPTPTPDQLLPVGKHDDTEPKIDYDRYWDAISNPGTANA
jgi:hypothetical protein